MDFSKKTNLNDMGARGSMQRLVYRTARAKNLLEWVEVNNLAHEQLEALLKESGGYDTVAVCVLNALCVATSKVVSNMRRAHEILSEL